MVTIYEVLKASGLKFTRDDCIGVGLFVKKQLKPLPDKVIQIEGWDGKIWKFNVFQYSDKQKKKVEQLVVKYFSHRSL